VAKLEQWLAKPRGWPSPVRLIARLHVAAAIKSVFAHANCHKPLERTNSWFGVSELATSRDVSIKPSSLCDVFRYNSTLDP
jgi:hypothetical protein